MKGYVNCAKNQKIFMNGGDAYEGFYNGLKQNTNKYERSFLMKRKKLLVIISAVIVVVLAIGTTTALAVSASTGGGLSSIWNILTDDQKEQLANEAEEKLTQDLADGKISQDQYDKCIEAINNGEMPFFGRFGRDGFGEMTDEQKAKLKDELAQKLSDGKITQEQYDKWIEAIDNGETPFFGKFGRGGRGFMSEEQRAAMDEMNSKWDALTDEQKAEIYDLNDQKAAIDNKIIDKYLEYGIIDSDKASDMKDALDSQKNDMRSNGRMPMPGGRGMRGGRPFCDKDK